MDPGQRDGRDDLHDQRLWSAGGHRATVRIDNHRRPM
jgi:hypothetical protein